MVCLKVVVLFLFMWWYVMFRFLVMVWVLVLLLDRLMKLGLNVVRYLCRCVGVLCVGLIVMNIICRWLLSGFSWCLNCIVLYRFSGYILG